MASSLPQPGDVFEGKYRLERVLGEGGFARVFEATDTSLGRAVAIKVLKPTGGADEVRRTQRFLREMRVIGGLNHPNIVMMFDHGRTADGLWFMVFERVGGSDLADILAGGPLGEAEATHILRQVLDALVAAHAERLLHRDIKPENIRVFAYQGDPLRVKLLDFGIATNLERDSRLTSTGKVVGTPRVMAPEQLRGQELSPATDLYSLGVVAYEMLTGRDSDNMRKIASNMRVELPLDTPASERLRGVINRMLEPNPMARFQSAAEVLERLNQHATPAAPAQRPRPRDLAAARPTDGLQRRTAWFAAAGTLIIALAISAALMTDRREREHPAPRSPAPIGEGLLRASGDATPQPAVELGLDNVEPAHRMEGCGAAPPFSGLGLIRELDGLELSDTVAYIPASYDSSQRYPLVVLLHESAQGARDFMRGSKFGPLADEAGFIVVAPEDKRTLTDAWNDSADIEIVTADIARVRKALCIDPDRIFVVGHAAGAKLALRAACEMPEVRAIATTVYRGWMSGGRPCLPVRPIPHIHVAPMRDGYHPVEGGRGCANARVLRLAEQERLWAERNRCEPKPRPREPETGGRCYEWSCEAAFVSCHVDGGRTWDGAPPRAIDIHNCDGPPNTFGFAATIWNFFETTAPERAEPSE